MGITNTDDELFFIYRGRDADTDIDDALIEALLQAETDEFQRPEPAPPPPQPDPEPAPVIQPDSESEEVEPTNALPIIGVAPIMVMWFGFDWQSKAAVVVIMTFFPMLVNTVQGLAASSHMERDLMRTYASSWWQTLIKRRLPAAMPFIFNALKINSTLALIDAIVAEFFGTPIVGMGFRISTEVGRMNVDMVWAEIAVAALAGSAFYGVIAMIERAVTFWHPSVRSGRT